MKEPNKLEINHNKNYYGNGLTLSHLSDTKKCHVMVSSYGEIISASLTKTEVKRALKWLTKWLEFRDLVVLNKDGGSK